MIPCRTQCCWIVVALAVALTACHKRPPDVAAPPASAATHSPEITEPARAADAELSQTLSRAQESLKSGSYDQAAAELLRMRMAGTDFSPQNAAAYRQTLSDAYSRALEAAAKGDPNAQAAVKMLRSAGGH